MSNNNQNINISEEIKNNLKYFSDNIKEIVSDIKKEINQMKEQISDNYTELNKRITKLEQSTKEINKEKSKENKKDNKKQNINISSDINNIDSEKDSEKNNKSMMLNKEPKKRGKYKKDKSPFIKSIQYLIIKDNKYTWKYSLSSYYENNKTAYYKCSDSNCSARASYDLNDINNKEINIIQNKKEINQNGENLNISITKPHSLKYENHSYIKYEIIKKDIKNLSKNQIIKKLKDFEYLSNFLKVYAITKIDICNSYTKLKTLFEQEYCKLEINYETIPEDTKNRIITKYKIKNNISEETEVDIKNILDTKYILLSAFVYLNNYKEFNTDFSNNLNEMTINNKKIVTKIYTNFIRNNINYKKEIYIIMNEEMEKNIILEDNSQYFADITYYALPPKPQKYKIFAILAFNNKLFKSVLCNISLIANENKETLITLFEYLKEKYKWNPKLVSIDFSDAEYNAFLYVFPQIQFIPCFFHFIVNISKRIKDLKSKEKKKKESAKNLLANIKLLAFIPLDLINGFFNLIEEKYKNNNKKFFEYFHKTYLNKKNKQSIFNPNNWNYNTQIVNSMNNNILFYTNNITESFNRTLNKKYIGFCKTMYNFKNAILDTIILYTMHNTYQEKKLSITRSLEHYVKTKEHFDLIENKDLKKIKDMYKEYLLKNKLPLNDLNEYNNSSDSDNYDKEGEFETDKEEKDSDSSSDNNIDYIKKNNYNHSDSSDEGEQNNKRKKLENTNIINKKYDEKKENNKSYKYKKHSKNDSENMNLNLKEKEVSLNNLENNSTKKKYPAINFLKNYHDDINIKMIINDFQKKLFLEDSYNEYPNDRYKFKLDIRKNQVNNFLSFKRNNYKI